MEELKAGDKVIATRDIVVELLGGELVTKAEEGTVLVIRAVIDSDNLLGRRRYRVSQLDMSKSFIAYRDEIRKA